MKPRPYRDYQRPPLTGRPPATNRYLMRKEGVA